MKKKKKSDDQKLVRLSIKDLLPEKISYDAVQIQEERLELYSYQIESYADATNRLEEIRDRQIKSTSALVRSKQALMVNAQQIVAQHKRDALSELKETHGLQQVRKELEAKLYDAVDFKSGLEVFNRASVRLNGRRFKSIEHINKWYPHLTVLEIALLA